MPSRLVRASWYRSHFNDFVVLVGVVVILAGSTAGVLKVYDVAAKTHKAVCALRQERVDGVHDAQRFLEQHPNGIPGITRADILRSIHTQQETVRAFRFADC